MQDKLDVICRLCKTAFHLADLPIDLHDLCIIKENKKCPKCNSASKHWEILKKKGKI